MSNETLEYIKARVDVDDNGCWLWKRSKLPNGYGNCTYKREKWYAHRLAWVACKGKIPEGQRVIHKCGNRSCANPEHLTTGTQKDASANGGKVSRISDDAVKDIIESHEPNVVMAKKYGITQAHISGIRARKHRANVEAQEVAYRKKNSDPKKPGYGSRLERSQIEWVKQQKANGETQKSIAERLGVHLSTVNLILKGKRWADKDLA